MTVVEPDLTEAAYLAYFDSCGNWGRWGEDDERGTLNLITPDTVAAAGRLVLDGVPVSCQRQLSSDYSDENPRPLLRFMIASGEAAPARGQHESSDWFGIAAHGHSITHLDSLGHFFFNGRTYNGRPADVVKTKTGVGFGSVEAAGQGIVTRGVLLDVPRARGTDALPLGTAITPEDLARCENAEGVTVRASDALLIRTGRDVPQGSDFASDPRSGLHPSCLPWLHQRDISLLGSDTAHEVHPPAYRFVRTPIHAVAIVAMGLWLLDNADLGALARACAERGRWEFLFMIAPLSLERATGSPVNPLAVF